MCIVFRLNQTLFHICHTVPPQATWDVSFIKLVVVTSYNNIIIAFFITASHNINQSHKKHF